ncbi:apolipoprotein L2-like [Sorex fumeus]|uniref:apolipoprotein L2-like n=1 Tax=Sorex fumeus TaxID=62283 RepID=UPI0024ADAAF2|nr:apolipoprotein L2-like [Sorex fumeus]
MAREEVLEGDTLTDVKDLGEDPVREQELNTCVHDSADSHPQHSVFSFSTEMQSSLTEAAWCSWDALIRMQDGPQAVALNSNFIGHSIDYIPNMMTNVDLLVLLCEHEIWKELVCEAEFTREEAEAAREGLRKQAILRLMEIKAILQQEQGHEGNIWKAFPEVKVKLGKRIEQLRELADRVDQVHKACTISNMVANSTGLVSGLLTIAGIGLIPVTGGVSVGLSTSAMGLGVGSAVAAGFTSIVEHRKKLSIEVEAKIVPTLGMEQVKELAKGVANDSKQRFSSVGVTYKILRRVVKHARAMNNSNLANTSSILSNNLVQKVLGNTAKTMTKKALVAGVASTGLSVLCDAYSLVQDSKELWEGAKTKSAEKMRQRANELEKVLEELNKFHESQQ